MPTAHSNGIDLQYETTGDPAGEPLLLVMGLGAQLIAWDDEFCDLLAGRGYFVVRYDNRDVGLSTKLEGTTSLDLVAAFTMYMQGQTVEAAYLLSDMAADGLAVLDAVGISTAHVVGASMGGMIAQTMAIEHPARVLSLTSIMSTTGEPDVGQASPTALSRLMVPRPQDRESAVELSVETLKVIGSPTLFDPQRARAHAEAAYDRCFDPDGVVRQMLAVIASGDRAAGLRAVTVPTLVIHGATDPLVSPSGGTRTAELVPGAELLMLDEMAHDLPKPLWPEVIDAIGRVTARANVAP